MLYDDLDALLQETYALWDPGWVTFNWRAYTYDHVQRVVGLSGTLCRGSGGDEQVTHLSALLHDITKPFDGEYLTDEQGKRLVDARGYWQNALRRPVRGNQVSAMYERLGLAGQLHNASGSVVAGELLRERGIDSAVIEAVALAIRNHLRPPEDADLPSRCLYDADTIDANIGLPAFVRNIYINAHFYDQRRDEAAPSLASVLAQEPLDFMRPYVHEKLPAWVEGKQRDFIPRLFTPLAREIAAQRIERLSRAVELMRAELPSFGRNGHCTSLDLILHYLELRPDPSMAQETRRLAQAWVQDQVTPPARALLSDIQAEMRGEY